MIRVINLEKKLSNFRFLIKTVCEDTEKENNLSTRYKLLPLSLHIPLYHHRIKLLHDTM